MPGMKAASGQVQSVMRGLRHAWVILLVLHLAGRCLCSAAEDPGGQTAASLLKRTLGPEFALKRAPETVWLEDGKAYLTLEQSAGAENVRDIVRYETETGKRNVLVAAVQLIPPGAKAPLSIEGYSMSPDNRRVLIFTNAQTVWREKTRGDYWVLNLSTGALQKLGGNAPASSLMFAKFSPDSSKVGYVRANNLYTEDLASGKIVQLTQDGSETVINGTSDWISEEEFDIRDGFDWSPDSRHVAFWQFDTANVPSYTLIYNLGQPRGDIVTGIPYPQAGVYPQTLHYRYPQPGTRNSKVRAGIAPASRGQTVWVKVSGDPSNTYIPSIFLVR